MTNAEKWLILVLRINAAAMLLATLAVVLPFQWMDEIHQMLGMGELPDVPIVGYLARSESALYAVFGAFTMFISFDPKRYRPIISLLAISAITFGGVMLIVDLVVGMPRSWTICEGPYVIALGCVILWLQKVAKRHEASEDTTNTCGQ